MCRARVLIALLAAALIVAPFVTASAALADDDNAQTTPAQDDPSLTSSTVQGVVYRITDLEHAQVIAIFDRSVTNGGEEIRVYVRDPALRALITNKTVCVGRFITATGVRTSVTSLDAEGIQVDPTTSCGTPPK